MQIKRVEEIMVYLDEYPALINTGSIRDAIELMKNFQIDIDGRKSLPRIILVMDKKDRLVGLVRRRDIFRGLEPNFLKGRQLQYSRKLFDIKIDPNLAEMSFDSLLNNMKSRAEAPISDVMIRDIYTIDYGDNITKAINLMVENNISLLPVMNEEKAVGVLRSVDIFHEIAKVLV